MIKEITNLVKIRTWDVIQKYEVPEGAKMILGTWDFQCERLTDGSFRKFKARFCVRRDIQKRLSGVLLNKYDHVV